MRLMRDVIVADNAEKQAVRAAEHSEVEAEPRRGDRDTGDGQPDGNSLHVSLLCCTYRSVVGRLLVM